MKIFVGADHRGFALKLRVLQLLKGRQEVHDLGTMVEAAACDYPEIAEKVAVAVAANPGSRGILLCMSGIGLSIAANKIPGAYAALAYNKEAAILSRQHNNANILVLGSKFLDEKLLADIVDTWLATAFEGGRHERRFQQIQKIEQTILNKKPC